MFIQVTTGISAQIRDEIMRDQVHSNFENYLHYAIKGWCSRLLVPQDISDYILQKYQLDEVKKITSYIWQEGIAEKKTLKIPTFFGEVSTRLTIENQLYKYLNALFNRINIKSERIIFVVLIAFVITAVGYCICIINKQEQQTVRREESRQYNSKPPSFTVQAPSVQKITKQFLVLVVSTLQSDFVESLRAKGHINYNDGELLYEITKYLWLGSENELLQGIASVNQYLVSKGQESEYDIYLIYIELIKHDERFKSNINQLDRYDAFRELADLSVGLEVPPRLQMEAYGNIEVYSR